MIIVAYIAGVLTLPALLGGHLFLKWAFGKTIAVGDCLGCANLPEHAIGDNWNIVEWFRGQWHDLWWSHRGWHRDAVADYNAKYE